MKRSECRHEIMIQYEHGYCRECDQYAYEMVVALQAEVERLQKRPTCEEVEALRNEVEGLREDRVAKGKLMQEMYKMASRCDCDAVCDEYISAGKVILWNDEQAKAEGEKG